VFLYAVNPVLNVAADNKTRIYGDANPAFTYGASGFIAGDDASVLGGVFAFGTAATTASGVGSYAVTGSIGTVSNPYNYTIAYTDGALSITPAALTVALAGSAGKVYDGGTAATLGAGNYALGNVQGNDDVFIGNTGGAYDTKDAGTGKLVTVTGLSLGGALAHNYTLGGVTELSGNIGVITPKALAVSADNASKVYGDADPALSYGYAGLVAGEGPADFTGSITRHAGENAGTYAIGQGTLAATGNYMIGSFTNGTLSITPAALTVTADNATRAYGAANPVFTASYAGFRNGDDAAVLAGLTLATAATGTSAGGAYAITGSGASASNYAITYVDGVLTVLPQPAAVIQPPPPAALPAMPAPVPYRIVFAFGQHMAPSISAPVAGNLSSAITATPAAQQLYAYGDAAPGDDSQGQTGQGEPAIETGAGTRKQTRSNNNPANCLYTISGFGYSQQSQGCS